MRLRTKASLLLVTIVASLLGLASMVSLKVLQDSFRGAISPGLMSHAQNTSRWLAGYREGALRAAEAIASELPREALARRDSASIEHYLEMITRLYPSFDNGVFLLDPNGKLWANCPRQPDLYGASYADHDFFQHAVVEGRGVISAPYLSEQSAEPVITFAAPLLDEAGHIQGVLGCSVRLRGPKALGGIHQQTAGSSGFVYVFSRSRMMVVHPDPERILRREVPADAEKMLDSGITAFKGVRETVSDQGIMVLLALQQVPDSDWIVAVQQPVSEAFEPLAEARYRLLLNVVAGALSALLLGLVVLRHFTAPLRNLQQMALHLAARFRGKSSQPLSDNGVHLREWESFRGDDEVMDLHRALRQFSDELAQSLETQRDVIKSWEDTFDAVPDMILILDNEQRIVRCNRALSQILNLQCREIVGRYCRNVVLDHNLPVEFCPSPVAMTSGVTNHRELHVAKLDRILHLSTTPLTDADGKQVGMLHVARDITDRKRTDEALRESEQRYHTLFDSALDPILLADEDGRVRDCNAAAERFFQTSVQGMIDTSLLGGPKAGRAESTVLTTTQQELLRLVRDGVPQRFEWTFHPLHGPEITAEVSLSRIVIGGRAGMLALLRDISKQKEVQQLIHQERDRLNAVLDASPVATMMISPEREVLLWNRAAEVVSHILREQVLGRPLDLSPILEDSSDPVLADLLLNGPETEILREHGKRGIRKFDLHPEAIEAKGHIVVSGRVKRVHVIACRVLDPQGQLLGIIQCAQDITKEEQLQKQLLHAQKMESIGTMAGGMAHEFNNILAAIQGYSQLAMMECEGQQTLTNYLGVVEASCERAANLVRNMLTFARADEGRKTPVKVNRLLASMFQLLNQTLPPDVTVELDLEPKLPFILADPNQVEQTVINLAMNAKDAMPKGGVISMWTRLHEDPPPCLSAEDQARQGPYVEIGVSDAGEGISEEIMDRIFDPFFTTKPPGKGTGLGLSIVYSIMENHHGCVLVDSNPNRGTRFRLFFPTVQDALISPSDTLRPERMTTGQGETILVVDDEERLREMLVEVLEGHGYSASLASDGREALDRYEKAMADGQPFDLVVLDLAMPVMSGQECIKELLAIDPEAKILVMSGLMEDLDKDEALRKVRRYLRKPFFLPVLLEEVRKALQTEDSQSA